MFSLASLWTYLMIKFLCKFIFPSSQTRRLMSLQNETDRCQSRDNPSNYTDLKAIWSLSNPEYLRELIKHHAGSQSPLVTLRTITSGLSPKPTFPQEAQRHSRDKPHHWEMPQDPSMASLVSREIPPWMPLHSVLSEFQSLFQLYLQPFRN